MITLAFIIVFSLIIILLIYNDTDEDGRNWIKCSL